MKTNIEPMKSNIEKGYLQFGKYPGPFLTKGVPVKHCAPDNWSALYESKWRKVHIQTHRTYIIYMGEKVTIQIWGV